MEIADLGVIKAGKLIDGTGADPVENATVLIEKGKIKAVGQNIAIPEGADIIDATGMTVMPGLICAHLHFFGSLADDTDLDGFTRPREVRVIKAVSDAKKCLEAGFTTVRDCGGMNGIYMRRAASEGYLSGIPRIISSAYALQNTLGAVHNRYMDAENIDARTSTVAGNWGGYVLICDGIDECIKATRYTLAQGADFVKILPSAGSYFRLDELKAISETAAYQGKYITSHCDDARQVKETILAGAKTIEHAVGIDDEGLELGIQQGVVFVSTLSVMQSIVDHATGEKRIQHGKEWAKGMREKMIQSYKKICKSGGIMAIGTDLGGEPLMEHMGTNAKEIELLVKYCDFTPMEAIVAATKHAAMACYQGDNTGTLEEGKLADIIVIDGDPLTDIKLFQDKEKVKTVILEGKVEVDRGTGQYRGAS